VLTRAHAGRANPAPVVKAMIIDVPATASSFVEFRQSTFSQSGDDDDGDDDDDGCGEVCSDIGSVSSAWSLSVAGDHLAPYDDDEAPTKKRTQIATTCDCILMYGDRVVTFDGRTDMCLDLPLSDADGDLAHAVERMLVSQFHVVLRCAPQRIATHLFTHPAEANVVNHLLFGAVSHFTARGPDDGHARPCFMTVDEAVHIARLRAPTKSLPCYTSARVAVLRSIDLYAELLGGAP
jgi:hypothetical protein